MQISQLQPAGVLAAQYGVKALVYGDPGTAKTPTVTTAPRPVLCSVEPGLLSMVGSTVPTWEAHTVQRLDEFFQWITTSAEAQQFDTVCIDSVSQMAELVLEAALKKNRDGRAAYGDLSRDIMARLSTLYFMPRKHVYLIAKKTVQDNNGILKARPFFPGQDLNVKVPHLYDLIMHMERAVPPVGGRMVPMFRTTDNGLVLARDRTGKLDDLEPPDLAAIFNKAMDASLPVRVR